MAVGIYPHYIDGRSNTRLYRIWVNMKTRCYNINASNYERYGGRGITICDEWKNDFAAFYNWAMSNGYSDDLTIDRINNNGNYEPLNCRWASYSDQNKNKNNTPIYSYNGVSFHQYEVYELFGVKRTTFQARIKRGLTVEQALKG